MPASDDEWILQERERLAGFTSSIEQLAAQLARLKGPELRT